jgi:hypothetical protein
MVYPGVEWRLPMENSHQPILARGAAPGVPTASTERQGPPERTYLKPNADPDAVVDEILVLLGKERFRSARRLAAEALARFPDHARISRAWRIFDNRGKAKISPVGPQGLIHEELEWLKKTPDWVAGKWVALVGSEAVASADGHDELMEALATMDLVKLPLVVRIDAIPRVPRARRRYRRTARKR